MQEKSFKFSGRGHALAIHYEPYRIIECAHGTVMLISYEYHGIVYIQGYCRRAIIDRWGVYCHRPFKRACDATLTRSWAVVSDKGLFLFRPSRLEIEPEQDWMRMTH